MAQMDFHRSETHSQTENRFVVAKGRDDGLEVWGSRCKLLYIEWINKCPSVEHRELYSIVNHNGKDVNMYIHIHYIYTYTILWAEEPGGLQSMGSKSQTWLSDYHFTLDVYESLFRIPETKHNIVNQLYFNKINLKRNIQGTGGCLVRTRCKDKPLMRWNVWSRASGYLQDGARHLGSWASLWVT